mmetsp:Transcript_57822/g.124214  ORF Transcript_57822/g.124214 Transcript_57822/m.124214 type:complete len:216 (-) Transcript_57822:687-1334(-)
MDHAVFIIECPRDPRGIRTQQETAEKAHRRRQELIRRHRVDAVWDHSKKTLARKPRIPSVRGVNGEEVVVASHHDKLRQRQTLHVATWINDPENPVQGRGAIKPEDARIEIILRSTRQVSELHEKLMHGNSMVHGYHHWHDSLDPRIHRSRHVRGHAAFACANQPKALERAALWQRQLDLFGERGQDIHRAYHCLNVRHLDWPFGLLGMINALAP